MLIAPPAGPGLAAVSGGGDSVALLLLLRDAGHAPTVAHFDHRLRPASAADAAFVRDFAATVNLPFALGSADVARAAAESKANVEATARRLRYRWLVAEAEARKCTWVATGHTADDQVETVLLALTRGTGLAGLRGIAPSRPLSPSVTLVRPVLALTRPELEAVLVARGQSWRTDATNADRSLSRARVRHEVVPILLGLNPRLPDAVARLTAQIGEVLDVQSAQLDGYLAAIELPRAGALVVLRRAALVALPRPTAVALIRRVWEREGWPRRDLDSATLARLVAAIESGSPLDLPHRVRLDFAPGVARLGPRP